MIDIADSETLECNSELDLVLISGMSGAGRTQAIHTF